LGVENNLLSRARITDHLARPTSIDGAAGDAADIIRDHWTKLREAGHLDDPVLEHAQAPVHWHIETLAVGALLIVLGIIAANV
jgi:hypothetical protein